MEKKEFWKDIPDYIGIYQVSNLGRVKSLARISFDGRNLREKILKPSVSKVGYCVVILCKNRKHKQFGIHQIVAVAFLGHKINGMKVVINHIDENKLNNRVENLEICSNRYNIVYSKKSATGFTGVSKHGKKYQAKIMINGKQTCLGSFDTPEEASKVYQKAYKKQEIN